MQAAKLVGAHRAFKGKGLQVGFDLCAGHLLEQLLDP